MAKKTAVKKEAAAVVPEKTLEQKLQEQAEQIEGLRTAVTSLQNAVDQIVGTIQRKFPYG